MAIVRQYGITTCRARSARCTPWRTARSRACSTVARAPRSRTCCRSCSKTPPPPPIPSRRSRTSRRSPSRKRARQRSIACWWIRRPSGKLVMGIAGMSSMLTRELCAQIGVLDSLIEDDGSTVDTMLAERSRVGALRRRRRHRRARCAPVWPPSGRIASACGSSGFASSPSRIVCAGASRPARMASPAKSPAPAPRACTLRRVRRDDSRKRARGRVRVRLPRHGRAAHPQRPRSHRGGGWRRSSRADDARPGHQPVVRRRAHPETRFPPARRGRELAARAGPRVLRRLLRQAARHCGSGSHLPSARSGGVAKRSGDSSSAGCARSPYARFPPTRHAAPHHAPARRRPRAQTLHRMGHQTLRRWPLRHRVSECGGNGGHVHGPSGLLHHERANACVRWCNPAFSPPTMAPP